MALLLADVGPVLVNLYAAAGKLPHLLVHQLGAAGADLDPQPHDRVAMDAQHALGAADAVALDKGGYDLGAAVESEAAHVISVMLLS